MEKPTKLMNRNFFLLWQGQFVSRIGTQVMLIALVFWIKHTTNSAALMGLMQMVGSLPAVLLGPVGGTFADRHSRRRIIVLSDVLRGLSILSVAVLMFVVPDATNPILMWIMIALVFSNIVSTFFTPAISAAVPDLVPESSIATANSLTQLSIQLSVILGQGIGGTLFLILGAPVLFVVDGLTYLFSAVSESFITIPQTIPERSDEWREQFAAFKGDIMEGFHFVWERAGLREMVFTSAILAFFTVPIITLLPFYVEDFLKVQSDWYGWLTASYSAGTLLGYLSVGVIRPSGQVRSRWMIAFIVMQAAGHGLLGLVRDPGIALVMAFVGGSTSGFVTVNITTILQITTPGEIRGRVFGLLGTLSSSLAPLSVGLAGVIADLLGQNIPLIYLSCGAVMTVLSLALLLKREVREFLAYETEDETPPIMEQQAVPSN